LFEAGSGQNGAEGADHRMGCRSYDQHGLVARGHHFVDQAWLGLEQARLRRARVRSYGRARGSRGETPGPRQPLIRWHRLPSSLVLWRMLGLRPHAVPEAEAALGTKAHARMAIAASRRPGFPSPDCNMALVAADTGAIAGRAWRRRIDGGTRWREEKRLLREGKRRGRDRWLAGRFLFRGGDRFCRWRTTPPVLRGTLEGLWRQRVVRLRRQAMPSDGKSSRGGQQLSGSAFMKGRGARTKARRFSSNRRLHRQAVRPRLRGVYRIIGSDLATPS